MSLRVCFVVNAVDETSVPADIATALVEHTDVEVDILAWFDAAGFHGDDDVGVTCLDAPDSGLGIDVRSVRRAWDILGRYDVVQVHHNHSGAFAKLICAATGTSLISREGNMRRGFTREGLVLNGLTNPLTDRVVCNSEAVYQSFRAWENWALPEEKVVIIPNGVDLDRIDAAADEEWTLGDRATLDPGSVVVGTAGLLEEQKDQGTLIRGVAAARSLADRPLELVLAGDGPAEPQLRALVTELGAEESIHFLGRLEREEVYAMLAETDIYAMPSLWEGFSAAAVEALASGTPTVFSDIPPFRLPYDEVALFHPPRDHESLARRLAELADDEAKRSELGASGRSLVEREYTIERIASQYRELYRSIAG